MLTSIVNSVSNFINVVFSKEAKKKLAENDREFLLDYILEKKAWIDATIYERKQKPSTIMSNKRMIITTLADEINSNAQEICRDFQNWHKKICRRTDFGMRYGVWQKFVNMTFKYLYCMKDLFPEFDSIWSQCHCPIDTIIAKSLNTQLQRIGASQAELELSYLISRSKKISWNNISEKNYETFQKQVLQVCEVDNITPLQFDFLYW